MAVGGPIQLAVNHLIQADPDQVVAMSGALLGLGGALTFKRIWGDIVGREPSEAQSVEMDMLDAAKPAEFLGQGVECVEWSAKHHGRRALFHWHPEWFRVRYSKGTTDVGVPVLLGESLVSDPKVIAAALSSAAGISPHL